jgi:hypothetical protein
MYSLHHQTNPVGGLMHSVGATGDLAIAGMGAMGMGVDDAMKSPIVKAGVIGLAIFGAYTLFKGAKPMPRMRNPRRKNRSRKRSR